MVGVLFGMAAGPQLLFCRDKSGLSWCIGC